MYRSIYAVTIRPKSLYEDVHASTGHPGYTGMQWHQKNTIGANYTDKDAAAPRGICQGCALGSAHQYPTNQHYVMSDTPHDPGQQFVVDAFTHHSVGHNGFVYAHLFTDLASRQVYPVFTKSKLVTELTTNRHTCCEPFPSFHSSFFFPPSLFFDLLSILVTTMLFIVLCTFFITHHVPLRFI